MNINIAHTTASVFPYYNDVEETGRQLSESGLSLLSNATSNKPCFVSNYLIEGSGADITVSIEGRIFSIKIEEMPEANAVYISYSIDENNLLSNITIDTQTNPNVNNFCILVREGGQWKVPTDSMYSIPTKSLKGTIDLGDLSFDVND